jgi:hypothetical protein
MTWQWVRHPSVSTTTTTTTMPISERVLHPKTLRINTDGRRAIAMVLLAYPEAIRMLAVLYHASRLGTIAGLTWTTHPITERDRLIYAAWRALGGGSMNGVLNRAHHVSRYWSAVSTAPEPTPITDVELAQRFAPEKLLAHVIGAPEPSVRALGLQLLYALMVMPGTRSGADRVQGVSVGPVTPREAAASTPTDS